MKKQSNTLFLAQSAMIAAIYVVLTVILAPFSYGEVQVRVSEALTILPVFTPAAIPGLFVGCLISNILGDVSFRILSSAVSPPYWAPASPICSATGTNFWPHCHRSFPIF